MPHSPEENAARGRARGPVLALLTDGGADGGDSVVDAAGRPTVGASCGPQDRRSGGGEGGRGPPTARSRGDVGEPSRKSDLMHLVYVAACAQLLARLLFRPSPHSPSLALVLCPPSHARRRSIIDKTAMSTRMCMEMCMMGMHLAPSRSTAELVDSSCKLSHVCAMAVAELCGDWDAFIRVFMFEREERRRARGRRVERRD